MIPPTENHLRSVLKHWVAHYNQGRPHSSLGPGLPHPRFGLTASQHKHRHLFPDQFKVKSRPILGGLHHEYDLVPTTV